MPRNTRNGARHYHIVLTAVVTGIAALAHSCELVMTHVHGEVLKTQAPKLRKQEQRAGDDCEGKFRQRVDDHYRLMASAKKTIGTAGRLQLASALSLGTTAGVAPPTARGERRSS